MDAAKIFVDNQSEFDLHQMNPWWRGNAMEVLPAHKRHLVQQIQDRLRYKLAPVIVVRGSRQIGKTTACLHVIQHLLESKVAPERIFRIQFDDIQAYRLSKEPILQLVYWYEQNIIKSTLNNQAQKGEGCYLFLDEVQNLVDWSTQLKFLVDTSSVQVVVTGSSALRIEMGRDSLAGRINTLEVGTLSLSEIGAIRELNPPAPYLPDNGISRLKNKDFWTGLHQYGLLHSEFKSRAFHFFSERGAYPVAHLNPEVPWELVADQLNETIIKRVIMHDLRLGDKGRKRDAQLLEELFRICCRYAGQTPGVDFITREIKTMLDANIGSQRVRAYLRFLADTLLIRLIAPLELRLKKKKGESKICLVDHGLRSSWLQEHVSLEGTASDINPDLMTLSGHIAESIVGSLLSSISGLDIAHLEARNKDPEIDTVLTVGDQRIPIEVKYRNTIKSEHIKGLQWFLDNPINRAPFGIIITRNDINSVMDERIVAISLSSLMLLR